MREIFLENLILDQKKIDEIDKTCLCEFESCVFSHADFSSFNFSRAKIQDSKFEHCNLSNVNLKNANIKNCEFHHTKLVGINWSEIKSLFGNQFFDCKLDYSRFISMDLKKSKFF